MTFARIYERQTSKTTMSCDHLSIPKNLIVKPTFIIATDNVEMLPLWLVILAIVIILANYVFIRN